jgi:hypothetical protein
MGVRRFRHLARTVAAGKQASRTVLLSVCEVGARMSERLGLGEGVRLGLLHNMERWDGRGEAYRLAGDDIALPARFARSRRRPSSSTGSVAPTRRWRWCGGGPVAGSTPR